MLEEVLAEPMQRVIAGSRTSTPITRGQRSLVSSHLAHAPRSSLRAVVGLRVCLDEYCCNNRVVCFPFWTPQRKHLHLHPQNAFPAGIYALLPLGHDVWVCGHHPSIQVYSQRDMATGRHPILFGRSQTWLQLKHFSNQAIQPESKLHDWPRPPDTPVFSEAYKS